MIEGTPVRIAYCPLIHWNGERGRIHAFFTLANGRRAAIVRMDRIALEAVFPLSELEAFDEYNSTDALSTTT